MNYIDKIGVEFEGLYDNRFFDKITAFKWVNEVKEDYSVYQFDSNGNGSDDLFAYEITTKPLPLYKITGILSLYDKAIKSGEYLINDTCGLHYHISVRRNAYGDICNPQFYKKYRALFRKIAPDVYALRWNNRFCRFGLREYGENKDRHFRIDSSNRYHAVNYCYRNHGTVEFRGYGGHLANMGEFYTLIASTVELINMTVDRGEFINKQYEEEKAYRECLNLGEKWDVNPKQQLQFNEKIYV